MKMNQVFLSSLLLAITFLFASGAQSQTTVRDQVLEDVLENVSAQVLAFPQEKVYLQTDKPYYVSGETMFYRIFLLNALSHEPAAFSRYVYVDVSDPRGRLIARQQVRPEDGAHYGSIQLPEELPQGNYQVQTYTKYMEQLGRDYFHTQYVYVADPHIAGYRTETDFSFDEDRVTVRLRIVDADSKKPLVNEKISLQQGDARAKELSPDASGWVSMPLDLKKKDAARTLLASMRIGSYRYRQFIPIPFRNNQIDISFYPEGGHILSGTQTTVAFKALNSAGLAEEVSGTVVDETGRLVTTFTTVHEGMGAFDLTAEAGKTYQALCTYKGKTFAFDLPAVQPQGFALKLTDDLLNQRIQVSVNKAQGWEPLYLFAHCRGSIYYAGKWDDQRNTLLIDKQQLPSGVHHLMLMNSHYQTLSERLFFVANDDYLSADLQLDKVSYDKRGKIDLQIRLDESQRVVASMAVSVTDDVVEADSSHSILTDILLTSELKGTINKPAYYFEAADLTAQYAANLLMMTHGWSRYDLPQVALGNIRTPEVMPEQTQTFAGSVRIAPFNRLYENANISVYTPYFVFGAKTDANGRFEISNFEIPDNSRVRIIATDKRGSYKLVTLTVDRQQLPEPLAADPFPRMQDAIQADAFRDYVAQADAQYLNTYGIRVINLDEVEVKGRRQVTFEKMLKYSEWDFVPKTQQEYEEYHQYLAAGYIDRFKWSNWSSGTPQPASHTLGSFGTPLRPFNRAEQALNNASSGSDHFGLFPTLLPDDYFNDYYKTEFTALGYASKVAFYSPVYDTPETQVIPVSDLRTTIYWSPHVLMETDGKVSLEFYAADKPGTYSIRLEGVTSDGQLIYTRLDEAILVERGEADPLKK